MLSIAKLVVLVLLVTLTVKAEDDDSYDSAFNTEVEIRLHEKILTSYRLRLPAFTTTTTSTLKANFKEGPKKKKLLDLFLPSSGSYARDGCTSISGDKLITLYKQEYEKKKTDFKEFLLALEAGNCDNDEKIKVAKAIGASGLIIYNIADNLFLGSGNEKRLINPCNVNCQIGVFDDKIKCEENSRCGSDLCLMNMFDEYCCAKDDIDLIELSSTGKLPVFFLSIVSGEFLLQYSKEGSLIANIIIKKISNDTVLWPMVSSTLLTMVLYFTLFICSKHSGQFENNQLVTERELIQKLNFAKKEEDRNKIIEDYKMVWYKLVHSGGYYVKLNISHVIVSYLCCFGVIIVLNIAIDTEYNPFIDLICYLSYVLMIIPVGIYLQYSLGNNLCGILVASLFLFLTLYYYHYDSLWKDMLVNLQLIISIGWLGLNFKFVLLRDVILSLLFCSFCGFLRYFYQIDLLRLYPHDEFVENGVCNRQRDLSLPIYLTLTSKLYFGDIFILIAAISYSLRVDYFKVRTTQVQNNEFISNQDILKLLHYFVRSLLAILGTYIVVVLIAYSLDLSDSVALPCSLAAGTLVFIREEDFSFLWATDLQRLEANLPKISFFKGVKVASEHPSITVQSMEI